MKNKYPSKEEIIKILLKENPNQKKMEKLILIALGKNTTRFACR